jgi:hypothetical protein
MGRWESLPLLEDDIYRSEKGFAGRKWPRMKPRWYWVARDRRQIPSLRRELARFNLPANHADERELGNGRQARGTH